MNQNHSNRNRHGLHMALAMSIAAFLVGCSVPQTSPNATHVTTSPAPSSNSPSVSADPVAVMTAATPAPGSTQMIAPGPRDVDADEAYTNEFLSRAWDTTEPKSLADVHIGDCLFFDHDYTATTTALFTVDCSLPHEGEVLGIFRHHESEYPGQGVLWGRARQAFSDTADSLREAGWITQGFSYQELAPTEADWEAGERTGLTILRHGDSNGLLEGSYLDSKHFKSIGTANG
jgi:hypothetical protein